MTVSHLDRQAVQKLIGLRERRARQLMAGLDGIQVGNAFAVSRLAFAGPSRQDRGRRPVQQEVNRRARVVEELDRTRRQLAAQRVGIPATADVEDRRMWDLSSDIALTPGELRIEFYGAEDLAA